MARFSIIALAFFLVSSVAAVQNAYIRFIAGGANSLNDTVTVQGDLGFIEIADYGFSIESATASAATGSGAGKPSGSPVTFTSKVDRNTAKFFQYQASGEVFDSAILKIVTNNALVAKYTFTTVAILEQTINGSTGADAADQKVAFEYEKIALAISTIESDGSLSVPETSGWNRVINNS